MVLRRPAGKWLLEKAAGLDQRRPLPRLARGSFLSAGRKYLAACAPIATPTDKVAYFVDTYANYNDHELGFAVVNVLRHNGVDVIIPPQRPAPLPAMVYGNVRVARRDLSYNVRHLAEVVRQGYKIVCSEPSAALCLREELHRYVAGDDATLVAQNTFELINYLDGLRRQDKLKAPKQSISDEFVYHLPCHMCAVGDDTVSLWLLREHFKFNVTDLQAGCCGLSGTFGMQKKNYDLSWRISESLRHALQAAPTQNTLTECAACKMQIEHVAAATATHPIKLIARSYGL
jgi:Fe-S oxidoreductase